MHVLVNAASANMGGSVTYLQNVLRWFPILAPGDRFTIYVPAVTKEKLGHLEKDSVRLVAYPHAHTGGARRMYFDQAFLPQQVRREGVDLLFSTTGFGTFFSPCPEILLVRNIAYFDAAFHRKYRELGRSLRRNTVRRWHSLLSISRSDVVLFPTEGMKAAVRRHTSFKGKRAEAILYGFDHEAFLRGGETEPEIVQRMRAWHEAGYRLILSVSTYAVQKNFETLIEALPHLLAQGHRVKLVTTTSREVTTDKAEYDVLKQRAAELGVSEAWIESGYVPYPQLHKLYSHADLYVFPSFAESFGHSMVEAMASGLPVVAANTPVNREICQDAGAYFRTFDPQDCAATIVAVLGNPEQQVRLAAASKDRAAQFSWERYTRQLLDIFRSTAGIKRIG
jgi:glycosyltransferase involved in cell wall biosynthesis